MPISLTAGTRSQSSTSTFNPTALNARIDALSTKIQDGLDAVNQSISSETTERKAESKSLGDRLGAVEKRPISIHAKTPPDFAREWDEWRQIEETPRAIKFFEYERNGADGALLTNELEFLLPPSHANSVPNQNGQYTNTLKNGVNLTYKTTLDLQNTGEFSMVFPAGTLTHWKWEGWAGTAYAAQSNEGNIAPTDTTFSFAPFLGDATVDNSVWTFSYSDGSIEQFDIPVER